MKLKTTAKTFPPGNEKKFLLDNSWVKEEVGKTLQNF